MGRVDIVATAAAGSVALGGILWLGYRWWRRRRDERIDRARWRRSWRDGDSSTARLDELLGPTYEACAMAPLEPVVVEDYPGQRSTPTNGCPVCGGPIEVEPCDVTIGPFREFVAGPWRCPRGCDPRAAAAPPMVTVGSRLVHPECAAARRDSAPGMICVQCQPALWPVTTGGGG